jgi:hypothetical protein
MGLEAGLPYAHCAGGAYWWYQGLACCARAGAPKRVLGVPDGGGEVVGHLFMGALSGASGVPPQRGSLGTLPSWVGIRASPSLGP